jgi:polysaccharide export outer membrane protein
MPRYCFARSGKGDTTALPWTDRFVASFAFAVALFLGIGTLALSTARAEDFLLGPQDTLKIRVFEWRPTTGTAFEWVPLTGEFVISPSGNLSLPIIGAVEAAGKTVEAVADAIGEKLQTQVGLQKRPNASVEVVSYRPFFVTGMVTQPGKYNYSPGLTVVQALSMAGGIGSVDPSLINIQRDALVSRGDVRALGEERLGLLARQARVEAALSGATKVTFPAEVTQKNLDPGIVRMMRDQQALLDTQLSSLAAELDALQQARVLALNQVNALNSKADSLSRQIELANKDVNSVNKLIAQGLTVSSRELAANQNLAELEGRSLDVALAKLKTQQDIAKFEQDTTEVHNRYRVSALTEAANLRDELTANAEKTKTAQSLINNLQARAPAAMAGVDDAAGIGFVITIDRNENGSVRRLTVDANDPIAPGDVLTVERLKSENFVGGKG